MPALPLPKILSADYLAEARELGAVPAAVGPEIAIAGRSNVGKSTLLNRLAARKSLARVSKTPGRTRGIILYDLAVTFDRATEKTALRLADLPGYGFAKVGKDERESWGGLVEGYLRHLGRVKLMFLLLDARREVGDEELDLAAWLAQLGLPWRAVITKTDKLSASERGVVIERFRRALGRSAPPIIATSGLTGDGVDRLWAAIERAVKPAGGHAAGR